VRRGHARRLRRSTNRPGDGVQTGDPAGQRSAIPAFAPCELPRPQPLGNLNPPLMAVVGVGHGGGGNFIVRERGNGVNYPQGNVASGGSTRGDSIVRVGASPIDKDVNWLIDVFDGTGFHPGSLADNRDHRDTKHGKQNDRRHPGLPPRTRMSNPFSGRGGRRSFDHGYSASFRRCRIAGSAQMHSGLVPIQSRGELPKAPIPRGIRQRSE